MCTDYDNADFMNQKGVENTEDSLILVDLDDEVIGFASKQQAHSGEGTTHRAFSIFLFDNCNKLLLHERSQFKPLWPGFWTNSCCSHPRRGEDILSAASRRLQEELGVEGRLEFVYKFHYRAKYLEVGSEDENCSVFLARLSPDQELSVNPEEISNIRWMTLEEIDHWISNEKDIFTPWFLIEWEQLSGKYRHLVMDFLANSEP